MVFNMDSNSLQEDNLIDQMKQAHKKIVFYGDDTWIKLFPEHFIRMDGTTSFFVTDYTEVKENRTKFWNGCKLETEILIIIHISGHAFICGLCDKLILLFTLHRKQRQRESSAFFLLLFLRLITM